MRTALISLAMSLFVGSSAVAADRPSDFDQQIAEFERRTGIDVHIVGDIGDKTPLKGTRQYPVDPAKVAKLLPEIERVLLHYNEDIRGRLLKDLYLVGKLRMRGKPFLGAAHPKTRSFDLAIRDRSNERKIRSTMHHEIAHLVENADFFPKEMWKAFSHRTYKGKEPSKAWAKGDAGRESAHVHGFVSKYASKNYHEDFAEMAELAFTKPQKMQTLARRYALIGDKLRLMTNVYRQISPNMSLPWTTSFDRRIPRRSSKTTR
jgi:hypothetical protein